MLKSTNAVIRMSTAVAVAGALAIGLSPALLSAAPSTFAQFTEAGTGGSANLFSYIDVSDGGSELISSTNGTTVTSIPVTFSFVGLTALPTDLQGPQSAVLTLTSSTSADNTVQLLGGGMFGEQSIDGSGTLSDILTVTRDTAALEGGTNLLTMDFTGTLLGGINGRVPQLSGSSVTYSSDFINFLSAPNDYSLTFSSWTSVGGAGLTADPSMKSFDDATAAGAGTFDASVVVPEPSTLALGGLLLIFGRRNKLSKLI